MSGPGLSPTPLYHLYRAASSVLVPFAWRAVRKKLSRAEVPLERQHERLGHASLPRPPGRLVWFHAASVGESLSLLEVIRRLGAHDPRLRFLVTTGTVTSAAVLAHRLPETAVHQFVPLDVRPWVRRFLDHWRPDLAVWTESEFWPALITETHAQGVPLLLLNARISEKSARRWQALGGAAKTLLGAFTAVHVQDDTSAALLTGLGLPQDRLAVTGTLKEGTPPLPCDEAVLTEMITRIAGRPVWCAASTHPGEEETVAAAHALARAANDRLLLISVPRHPERGEAVESLFRAQGFETRLRSRGEMPDEGCDVYVADTLGEMGLWYRLAPVSFLGGSLTDIGGHNPYEPAALGSAILHGPYLRNFQDIYARLRRANASIEVATAEDMAAALELTLNPARSAPMAHAAWEVCSSGADVTDKALALILVHLPEPAPV